ncbi:MAG: VapC toxin family PIN domain ribonuclease [Actinomycetota bacterium]|nr:VapC toxin family PIN domain ribonuclease [Actinomycetota bacterium]MDA2950848.1 VapC toxin family PIN domain ribonuclease [Actinomycetota bacterium]
MIVIDASTALAGLLNNGKARELLAAERVCAPDIVDTGVVDRLRQLTRSQQVSADAAQAALETWYQLGIRRYPSRPLAERVWELNETLDTAPATSAALAERLDIAWVTADPVAGASSAVTCPVTVVPN